MRKKLVLLAVLLLCTSFTPFANAACAPGEPLDPNVWCQAMCNTTTTWCEWSLVHKPTDSCYDGAGWGCSQMAETHCQCESDSLSLF